MEEIYNLSLYLEEIYNLSLYLFDLQSCHSQGVLPLPGDFYVSRGVSGGKHAPLTITRNLAFSNVW
jgi:hypothetical protein